jgi:carbamoyl-phosphate synthase large subunit
MKCDRSGTPRVTEINAGRFFTTSNFFAYAGLNMPWIYLQLAMGGRPPAGLPRTAPLPAGLWWVRNPDMGFALVKDAAWSATSI